MKSIDKPAPKMDSVNITLDEPVKLVDPNPSEKASSKKEQGGYKQKVEPTRYGDWEIAGRCIDF